jgi:hypothetical protein
MCPACNTPTRIAGGDCGGVIESIDGRSEAIVSVRGAKLQASAPAPIPIATTITQAKMRIADPTQNAATGIVMQVSSSLRSNSA